MGFLKLFSRISDTGRPGVEGPPTGSLAISRAGCIVASTLSSDLPTETLVKIGRTALHAFAAARRIKAPLNRIVTHYEGMTIVAVELRGGALVFLNPTGSGRRTIHLPPMSNPNLDDFILYVETYIECWKQFNHYLNVARQGEVAPEDETQFLEIKSLITQGLEVIAATVERGGLKKDEVTAIVSAVPSLRYLKENERAIAGLEGQWHKVYVSMQSLLGRLKVQQQKEDGASSSLWGSLFGRER